MTQARLARTGLRWLWLESIDAARREQMARLLNHVLETDDTVGHPGPIPHDDALAIVGDLAKDVAARRAHVLIAENDVDVTSQCVLVPNRWPNNRHIGWVIRTMIDSRYRGIGILTQGMRLLARKSEELELTTLCIDVRRGTPAEALWLRMGFKVFGVLPDYSRVRGRQFEGAYMAQTVAELRKRWND